MAFDTYTPLFSETLEKVGKLKTKKEKIEHLQKYNTEALRMVIKSSFDPKIEWALPEGEVCLLYTSPSPRDLSTSRMPSSA